MLRIYMINKAITDWPHLLKSLSRVKAREKGDLGGEVHQ